ncbi:hypothetical protein C1H76_7526 [Elsinoe australis]|uniref:DUF7587 domain-containing protein n=1 Tax=Elsinoe australis TaxID=40998 RepID=A0A4U7AQ34_9PEZI|nr:hypothetical protein C1H76_7526 [Elsinoe australis]
MARDKGGAVARPRSSPMHKSPSRSQFKIHWTEKKLLTLSAAVIAADGRFDLAAELWGSVYSLDARRSSEQCSGSKPLLRKIKAQWKDRNSGARAWRSVPITEEDLLRKERELLHRFRAAVAEGLGKRPIVTPPEVSEQPIELNAQPPASQAPLAPECARRASPTPPSSLTPIEDNIVVRSDYFAGVSGLSRTSQAKRDHQTALAACRNAYQDTDPIPYVPVRASDAHPALPALFYRMYPTQPKNHAVNDPLGPRGFVSGYYAGVYGGLDPPPDYRNNMIFTFIERHLSRDTDRLSPLISVSASLWFVLRKSIKHQHEGDDVRVSIIDAKLASGKDGKWSYHAKAYTPQIKARKAFNNGGWRYCGCHEFLIWGRIPPAAVVADISIRDLVSLSQLDTRVARVFRFDMLHLPIAMDSLRERIKAQATFLDRPDTLSAMAAMVHWFSLQTVKGGLPSEDKLTKIIGDIVWGWHIRPSGALTHREWTDMADTFVKLLEEEFEIRVGSSVHWQLAKAFLYGMYPGFSDQEWLWKEELQRSSIRKAKAYGMDWPEDMLRMHENPVVLHLQRYRYEDSTDLSNHAAGYTAVSTRRSPRIMQTPQNSKTKSVAVKETRPSPLAKILDKVEIPRLPPTPNSAVKTGQ